MESLAVFLLSAACGFDFVQAQKNVNVFLITRIRGNSAVFDIVDYFEIAFSQTVKKVW